VRHCHRASSCARIRLVFMAADMHLWGKRRYFAEELVDPISITAGLVQTGLYLDFFYVYFTTYVARAKYSPFPIVLTLSTHPRTGFSRARSSSCQRDGCPPTAATCFTRTALVSSRARRESRLELYPVSIVIFPYARLHDEPSEISVYRDKKCNASLFCYKGARDIPALL
jgi:hypothetical protein